MKRLVSAVLLACVTLTSAAWGVEPAKPAAREIAPGPFRPDWESLKQYQCPEWFRDAKFGIWAHWTAQCVPEQGDWYARGMYMQGSPQYNYHVAHYGHPSTFGFKDIDNLWKAERWDPEKLMRLYKRAGAKYFVATANHHDNFDCFDSKYQPWNSVKVGPKKDIVGTWAKIARANGLRFGATVHCSQAWHWFQVAYGHDLTGPLANVPYDGWLTKADGKGLWWEGLDPKDLYCGPCSEIPKNITTPDALRKWWDSRLAWSKAPPNDPAYVTKWFNRVKDLIDKYDPDLLYFDDSQAPMGEAGLNVFAHYYNANIQRHNGKLDGVLNTKGMPKDLLKTLVHDFERGRSDAIEAYPWQTDTCIGDWHYKRELYEKHAYKTPQAVIRMLVDIVSKNGNLLLNIPVRGDGTIDDDEVKFLEGMAAWMAVNSECIFGTRPWRVSGEGPVQIKAGQFSEGGEDRFTGQDFRFTAKGDAIYAIALAWPGEQAAIKSLAKGSSLVTGEVAAVRLLGCERDLDFSRTKQGLVVKMPNSKPCEHAFALKITGLKTVPAPSKE
jgi:alpha-L-fucosidase